MAVRETSLPPTWLRRADRVPRLDRSVTRVLAVGNNRGEVGKTVTVLELGIGLAHKEKRVLVLDLDGQGSLTLALPPPKPGLIKKDAKKKGAAVVVSPPAEPPPVAPAADGVTGDISQYFASAERPRAERVPLASLVRATAFERLYVVPAGQILRDQHGARLVRSNLNKMDMGSSAHPQDELAFVEAIADVAARGAPVSKEPTRRGCAGVGCAARATLARPKPTSSTS